MSDMLYIGCPVWGYKEWVGNFFPARTTQSDFLRLYSQKFPTVEGNTTFYALPSEEMVDRWRAETPESFRFCPKVLRTISHTLPLDTHQADLATFIARLRGLGPRLGPIFLQLPSHFAPVHLPQLEHFLAQWSTDLRLAVEVRHPDLFNEPHETRLNTLLQAHNVARVMLDVRPIYIGPAEEQRVNQSRERKPNVPLHAVATSDFVFLRYIGHPRMEVNEPLLQAWAQQIATWIKQGITPYIFCHCPYEVHSPEICYRFYEHVRALVPLPDLAWQPEEPDQNPEQMRLF